MTTGEVIQFKPEPRKRGKRTRKGEPEPVAYWRPGAGYYRRAIKETDLRYDLRDFALSVTLEWDRLQQWVRQQGMTPPRFVMLKREADDKPEVFADSFNGDADAS